MKKIIFTVLVAAMASSFPVLGHAEEVKSTVEKTSISVERRAEVRAQHEKRMQERFDKMDKMTPEEREAYIADLYKNPTKEWDTLHAEIKKQHIQDVIKKYDEMPPEMQKALRAHILAK